MSVIADAKLRHAEVESFTLRVEAIRETVDEIIEIFKGAYIVTETRKAGKMKYEINGIDGFNNHPTITIDYVGGGVNISISCIIDCIGFHPLSVTKNLRITASNTEAEVYFDFGDDRVLYNVTHISFLKEVVESSIDVLFEDVREGLNAR